MSPQECNDKCPFEDELMKGLTQNLLLPQFTAQAGLLGVGEPREGGLWSLLVLSPSCSSTPLMQVLHLIPLSTLSFPPAFVNTIVVWDEVGRY